MPRGETQAERPLEAKQPATPEALKGAAWQRIASKSQPGRYYYFNPATGQTEMKPPVVEKPWQLLKSKTSGEWCSHRHA